MSWDGVHGTAEYRMVIGHTRSGCAIGTTGRRLRTPSRTSPVKVLRKRHSTETKSVEQLPVSPRPRVFLYSHSHDDTALAALTT